MNSEAKVIIAVLIGIIGMISMAFMDVRSDLRQLRHDIAGQRVMVQENHERVLRLEKCVLTCEP